MFNRITKNNLNSKKNERAAWFLLFVFPVLSFYIAVRNFQNKRLRKFIVFFGLLYGFTFVPIPSSDATRYAVIFENIQSYSFSTYLNDITHITDSDKSPDIYANTLFFTVSKISDKKNAFFAIAALIYFAVFVGLVGVFYDLDPFIPKKYYFIFFLGIIFILDISAGLNGVRWPLGLIVFLYGSINLLLKKGKKFLLIAAISPLIHFTLILPVFSLLIFYFIPFARRPYILFSLIIVAALAGTLLSSAIFGNIDVLGDSYSTKLDVYTTDYFAKTRESVVNAWNWYVPIRHFGTYFFSLFTMVILWVKKGQLKNDEISRNLFSFTLLMIAVSLIMGGMVDLITNRYLLLVNFYALSTLIYVSLLNKNSQLLKTLSRIYLPIIILTILMIIRVDTSTISPWLLTNPVIMYMFGN